MKKVFDVGIGFIIIVLFLCGIGCIIASFSKNDGSFFVSGVGSLIAALFLMGFFWIVEAACMYIERCNREEYEKTNIEE